ncbi:hypothetical protein ACGFYU_30230 [Streptomyces sp. NPDC048337]|uniref:hypothetical protein n=1 Tax=Streptomyces sp. NPDC048337 TaxID=3365535 RepID=UPI00371B79B7
MTPETTMRSAHTRRPRRRTWAAGCAVASLALALAGIASPATAADGPGKASAAGKSCKTSKPKGKKGPKATCPAPLAGYEVVVLDNQLVAAHDNAQAIVPCPAGKKVIGGGFFGFIPEVQAFRSFPQGSEFTAWVVVVQNNSNVTSAFDAYAICANVES